MNKSICAPGKYDSKNDTCLSNEQVMEMARAFNRYVAKKKLNPNESTNYSIDAINIKDDKKYLLTELLKRFNKICNGDQMCITRQAFMNEVIGEMKLDIDNNTYRPKGPSNPKEWLGTENITEVMQQYEKIYPDFKFFGAVPFDCNDYEFCSLYKPDYDKFLKSGIKQIATVLNLDKLGQPGSHWVALYMNLSTGEVYFSDSNGHGPTGNIKQAIHNFADYIKSKNKQLIYKYNPNPYQKDTSECGVYSCNFIIRKLAGESFDSIINNALDFKDINSCRNVYFSNKPSSYTPNPKCDPTQLL